MSVVWTGWMLFVLVLISVLFFEMARKAKEKIIVEAYTDMFKKGAEDRKLKGGLKHVGEFKDEFFNKERRCWELKFRNGVSNYFKVYSILPMINYLKLHIIKHYYLIVYAIRAQFYKVELNKKEQYHKELGWSVQAYFYKVIYLCFSWEASGIILSMVIVGFIFLFSFPEITFAVIVGVVVGLILSTINNFVAKTESVQNNLLKKRSVLVTEEIFLVPLVDENEFLEVYRVKGTRVIEVATIDNATTTDLVILRDKKTKESKKTKNLKKQKKLKKPKKPKKTKEAKEEDLEESEVELEIVKKEEKPEKPSCKTIILQDEDEDYLTVVGYDALEKLRKDEYVNITSIVQVGTETRKRTPEEMNNFHGSYLSQNKFTSEELFRLKRINKKIQDEYLNLQLQMQHLRESQDQKVRKALKRMIDEQEKAGNTLENVLSEVYGAESVGQNFEETLERVMRRLKRENMTIRLDKIEKVYKVQIELMKLMEEKSGGMDFNEIAKLLEIKQEEITEEGS